MKVQYQYFSLIYLVSLSTLLPFAAAISHCAFKLNLLIQLKMKNYLKSDSVFESNDNFGEN